MTKHARCFSLVAFLCFIGCSSSEASPAADDPRTIPCEPRRILQTVCQQCHSDPPQNQAPFPLIDRGDVLATRADTVVRENMIAQVERQRMPAPPATMSDADRKILLDWLKAGAPEVPPQECASEPGENR